MEKDYTVNPIIETTDGWLFDVREVCHITSMYDPQLSDPYYKVFFKGRESGLTIHEREFSRVELIKRWKACVMEMPPPSLEVQYRKIEL